MKYPASRILIFAKAPIPGQVKTRLNTLLNSEDAARLHAALVMQTIDVLSFAALAPLQLWCTPSIDMPLFQRLGNTTELALFAQQGIHLGDRMCYAFTQALRESDYAIAVGTDWPALEAPILVNAFECLIKGDDAVFVPAEDGGYVLIGLRRAHARLFADVPWGSERVMSTTRARLVELGWRWSELASSWDLDRPEDFERALRARLIRDPRINENREMT